jgi:hypothetical protein
VPRIVIVTQLGQIFVLREKLKIKIIREFCNPSRVTRLVGVIPKYGSKPRSFLLNERVRFADTDLPDLGFVQETYAEGRGQ